MARFILLVLTSIILACDAKFPTGLAPCRKLIIIKILYYYILILLFIVNISSIPEVFNFPGTATVSYESKRSIDLPADLVMKFQLKKVAPFVYDVPCVLGQGSW